MTLHQAFAIGVAAIALGSAEPAMAQAYPTSDRRGEELPIWLHRYNWHRPHGGIKSKTPISRLVLTKDNLLRLHS
jgi:putative transposase